MRVVVVGATGNVGTSLPALVRRGAGRLLDQPLTVLKGLHSGIVCDYVAWLTFGVAALGGLVALIAR